jgi:type IV secretory pathway VirJ component
MENHTQYLVNDETFPLRHWRTILGLTVVGLAIVSVAWVLQARKPPTAVVPVWTPVTSARLSHGRFPDFTVYVPHAPPRGFVLFLSGDDGWTPALDAMAKQIGAAGAMVAGIDGAKFAAVLANDGGQCVFPDGDLENLSRFVQAYYRLPNYLMPILAGVSSGGTLAYATLVQAPTDLFAGAVSAGFCPAYALSKPLCKGSGLEFTALAPGKGVEFLPSTAPGLAWTAVQSALQAAMRPACERSAVQDFVARVPGAHLVNSAGSGTQEIIDALDALMRRHPAETASTVPGALSDLPIVTVPAVPGSPAGDTFAIILSGDGGWAGLDKDVAGALSAAGIPVIGLDSLRYFWSPRTPAGLAADIERMTRYYLAQLGKQRVLLIGYSQGADVLPFAVNLLPQSTRSHVAVTAIMGMSEHALFEFHMTSWIADDNSGPATLPEVDKISGIPVLCIYGAEETDSLCPKLDPHKATIVKLKGGHHFDGDYAGLARLILTAAVSR